MNVSLCDHTVPVARTLLFIIILLFYPPNASQTDTSFISKQDNRLQNDGVWSADTAAVQPPVREALQDSSEFEMDRMTVYGQKDIRDIEIKQSVSAEQMKKLPGCGAELMRVLDMFPAANRTQEIEGVSCGLTLHGSNTDDIRYYLDGVPLFRNYHLQGLTSALNTDFVARTTMLAGNFGPEYGNSTTGVIEFHSLTPSKEYAGGHGGLNIMDANASLNTPLRNKRYPFFSSVRVVWLPLTMDYISHQLFPQDDTVWKLYFWEGIAKVTWSFDSLNSHRTTLINARDYDKNQMVVQIRPDDPAYFHFVNPAHFSDPDDYFDAINTWNNKNLETRKYRHDATRFIHDYCTITHGWDRIFSESVRNSLRVSGTPSRFRYSEPGSSGGTQRVLLESSLYNLFLRDEVHYRQSGVVAHTLGFDLDINRYSSRADRTTLLCWGNYEGSKIANSLTYKNYFQSGIYYYTALSPAQRLTFVPGFRLDYYSHLDYSGNLIPLVTERQQPRVHPGIPLETTLRAAATYMLSPSSTLSAAMGTYNRANDPLYNRSDVPVKSTNVSLGYEFDHDKKVLFNCQIYGQREFDMQEYVVDTITNAMNPNDIRWGVKGIALDGRARMYGTDVWLKYTPNDAVLGWFAYSLSRSERWDSRRNRYILYSKDATHNIKCAFNWFPGKGFEIGIGGRYTTGFPLHPIANERYFEHKGIVDPVYFPFSQERTCPYISVDFKIEKRFRIRNRVGAVYLDIKNISCLFFEPVEYASVSLVKDTVTNTLKVEQDTFGQSIPVPFLGIDYVF